MEVHYDKDKRKDLVFTIQEDDAGHVEIIIDQQRPPCGDFQQVGHYSVPVTRRDFHNQKITAQ